MLPKQSQLVPVVLPVLPVVLLVETVAAAAILPLDHGLLAMVVVVVVALTTELGWQAVVEEVEDRLSTGGRTFGRAWEVRVVWVEVVA